MITILVYCKSFPALLKEMKSTYPDKVNEEVDRREDKIIADKTPVKWKGDQFVCRIRLNNNVIELLNSIEEVEEDDPRVLSVYPRTPIKYKEEGIEYTYTPPPIGEFA